MQNRTLPSSLLIAAALVLPSMAIAAPVNTGNIMPADVRITPAPNTLQAEIEGPDGELLATQPGEVEVNDDSPLGMPDTVVTSAPVNTGNVTPADMRILPAPNTLRAKIHGPDGELLSTQPGEVELNEQEALKDDAVAMQPHTIQRNNANYQPLIVGENPNSKVTPADVRITPVPITLKAKIQGPDGELLATQPGEVEVSESRRFVVR